MTVELTYGELLSEPAEVIRYAYFPADGFISLIATVGRHTNEVSLIGNEGMFSPSSVLGSDVSPLRALVQGAGGASTDENMDLRRAADDHATVRDTLNRYLCVDHRGSGANRRLQRLSHDRSATGALVTDDARSCAFRSARADARTARDDARRAPQRHQRRRRRPTDREAIRYSRGEITILDRGRLEDVSCECYRAAKKMYRRYLG